MGRACDKYGGEEKCIQDFDGETGRKEITRKNNIRK
jgi:hypothetical protein